jgi:hypothetical protein
MTNCILKASPHLIFRVFSKVPPQISTSITPDNSLNLKRYETPTHSSHLTPHVLQDADAQPKALCHSLDQMNLLGLECDHAPPSALPSPPLSSLMPPAFVLVSRHYFTSPPCPDRSIRYHLRFPSDYPDSPPLVRVYRPHLQGGFVLPSGAVCALPPPILTPSLWPMHVSGTEALQPSSWRAKHSFEGVFRGIFFLQGFGGANNQENYTEFHLFIEKRNTLHRLDRIT